ncbi:hypothetical protein BH20ACT2_BH20ACT2_03940 [soil metagenome]
MTVRIGPPRRTLVIVWCAAALFFGVLLALARATDGPLDDPDPAFQRPGFLDVGVLPEPAPVLDDVVTFGGHRTVVFFERVERLDGLCDALAQSAFGPDVQVVVVSDNQTGADTCAPDVPVVAAPALADRYGIRSPRGGGSPVGYAIVDDDGLIRYRTLDPAMPSLLGEVETILGALR